MQTQFTLVCANFEYCDAIMLNLPVEPRGFLWAVCAVPFFANTYIIFLSEYALMGF